jgi:predicted molibdopterin-dependent oxidoreductase YjgC
LQKLEELLAPPGSARAPWEALSSLAGAMGTDLGWGTIEDVWAAIRSEVHTHHGIEFDRLSQPMPPSTLQYESGFEAHHPLRAVAGPGAGYPKGYRAGAPFQTGQNWPLSWELRAFEARQRPGLIPGEPASNGADGGVEDIGVHPDVPVPERFVLYTGRLIYDEGAMVSKTAVLHGLAKRPFIEMNPADIEELGVRSGDEVVISGNGNEGRARLVASDIARGAVFVPFAQPGLAVNSLVSNVNPTVEVKSA